MDSNSESESISRESDNSNRKRRRSESPRFAVDKKVQSQLKQLQDEVTFLRQAMATNQCPCQVRGCLETFKSSELAEKHVRNSTDKAHMTFVSEVGMLSCPTCSRPHKRQCDLSRHLRTSHHDQKKQTTDRSWELKDCIGTFPATSQNIKNHTKPLSRAVSPSPNGPPSPKLSKRTRVEAGPVDEADKAGEQHDVDEGGHTPYLAMQGGSSYSTQDWENLREEPQSGLELVSNTASKPFTSQPCGDGRVDGVTASPSYHSPTPNHAETSVVSDWFGFWGSNDFDTDWSGFFANQ